MKQSQTMKQNDHRNRRKFAQIRATFDVQRTSWTTNPDRFDLTIEEKSDNSTFGKLEVRWSVTFEATESTRERRRRETAYQWWTIVRPLELWRFCIFAPFDRRMRWPLCKRRPWPADRWSKNLPPDPGRSPSADRSMTATRSWSKTGHVLIVEARVAIVCWR